jgi:tetratricopeptide (TPR) repeat protein
VTFLEIVVLASLSMWPTQAPSSTQTGVAEPAKAKTSVRRANFEELSKAADRARDANRDDEAIQLYQQALTLRPEWQEGLWYSGTLLYQKEQYAGARDLLRRFVAYDPTAGPGWAVLGMSEFQTRDYVRSLDHLQRAMGLGLGGRKELAESVFYFVSVLLTRFEQFDESMNLLLAMVKAGQSEDLLAEPIGLAALRLPLLPAEIPSDRRDMVRIAGRGTLALEAQHVGEAEKLFSGLIAAYPDEPGTHFLYGAFLMDIRPEDGIKEMQRELQISPFSVPARLRIAEEYIKEERVADALPLAQEAVKIDPKRGVTHMMLGEVLVAKGDLAGGIAELEAARQKAPDTVRVRWDLLRAYTSSGRSEDAKREKEEIEKLSHPSAQ